MQSIEARTRKIDPRSDFTIGLPGCRERRSKVLERRHFLLGHTIQDDLPRLDGLTCADSTLVFAALIRSPTAFAYSRKMALKLSRQPLKWIPTMHAEILFRGPAEWTANVARLADLVAVPSENSPIGVSRIPSEVKFR